MMIANAQAVHQYGEEVAPSTPYCNESRTVRGPAWANSLFEDNAEYGYGMHLGVKQIREKLADLVKEALDT